MARAAGERLTPYDEPELMDAVRLCDGRGRLAPESVGWSRRPVHMCNLSGRWPRKKKWNYWCVADERRLFSVTMSNIDYMGLAFAYFLDFETRRFIEQTVMVPFAKGCDMPGTVDGDVLFTHPEMRLAFTGERGGTCLRVDSPSFGGTCLTAEILALRSEDLESMNVVIPWSRRKFQFTSKQNCMPASGTVEISGEKFSFEPETAFACLDFGRGIWPYSSGWNWGSFSGRAGGRLVGANLGAGWTDGTGMTENAVWIDGRLTKLHEDVTYAYNRRNIMEPWTIRTTLTNRVHVRFEPMYERIARTNYVILGSEIHQMIGRYYGTVMDDSGTPIELDGIIGWAEEHKARW